MARKASVTPRTCPADQRPDEAAVQAMLDAAIDGHAFLAQMYNLPAAEIEKIDMCRIKGKLYSFAAKDVALRFHQKISTAATALEVPPSDFLEYAKRNVAVMSSRTNTIVENLTQELLHFDAYKVPRALATRALFQRNRFGGDPELVRESLVWMNGLVARGVVKPLSTPVFMATYFTTACTDDETRAEIEAYARIQKEYHGHPPRGLCRQSKEERRALLARLQARVLARAARPLASKKPARNGTPTPQRAKKPAAVWQLIEGDNQEFVLAAPHPTGDKIGGATRLTPLSGRILRVMMKCAGIAGENSTHVAEELGFKTTEAFAFAVARMVSVVRELENKTPGRPRLLQGRFANGDLALVPNALKYERRTLGAGA